MHAGKQPSRSSGSASVCPTSAFGESLHNTILHLRLVNDAPFPSRNLGPWMRIFAEHPDKQRRSIGTAP